MIKAQNETVDIQGNMSTVLAELLRLCLKAKEHGIDAFFNYQPHVDWVDLTVYKNGWNWLLDENGNRIKDEESDTYKIVKRDYETTISLSENDTLGLDRAIKYLTDCIEEKAPQELAPQESQNE